jgi:SPP1 family phage portal protein
MFGRAVIYTDEPIVTAENVVSVLQKAVSTHSKNASEIQYLWDYYRGKTPILGKIKEVRPEINHKINVNRANEIVMFKRGYGFGEPIQYVRRGTDESLTDDVAELNDYMFTQNKHAEDSTLAEWLYVGGVGVRMALPGKDSDEPFKIYTLDPRSSFVIRYNGLGNPVVAGVKVVDKENNVKVYSVYTPEWYFEIENDIITKTKPHTLGMVPIFEYPANTARLGAFEIALPLLDAISEIESNRLDDVVQYVNSFLALLGGTIDDETAAKLNEHKMLCLPEGVDAKYLSVAMQQNDTQVLSDNMYEAVLTICGIPNRNGGSSTSDTGSAVIMRDGWEAAESHMKSVENEFKRSEREFLKLILRILRDTVGTGLTLKDLDIKFSRRNYDNLQTKSQVLTTMLTNPKIDPYLAFTHCGMFLDPESAYLMSKAWWEANEQKQAEEVEDEDAETDPLP